VILSDLSEFSLELGQQSRHVDPVDVADLEAKVSSLCSFA
jgi:hypothetical protein